MDDWQLNLIAYGTHLLAAQLGQTWPPPHPPPRTGSLAEAALQRAGTYETDERLKLTRNIVHDAGPGGYEREMASIFSLLRAPIPPPKIPPPEEDSLLLEEQEPVAAADVWAGFWAALNRLSAASQFDTFFYLLAHYGRDVPGTVTDPARSEFWKGISVFEQFKAVAALCHCLNPDQGDHQPLRLVAGDLPGIQRTLYTLTSRGAAKTLRGRSAYLQLLGDAIIRYLLRGLGLSWTNVVLNAGGNFMLLVPGDKGAEVDHLASEINRKLLELHRAELHLALAHVEIQAWMVADPSHRQDPGSLVYARHELRRLLAAAKEAPFAHLPLADDELYTTLFEPFGRGGPAYTGGENGNLCAICHTEGSLELKTLIPIYAEQPEDAVVEPVIEMVLCEQCHSLGSHRVAEDDKQEILPYQMAHADELFIKPIPPVPLDDGYLKPYGGSGNPAWDVALRTLGFEYEFRWSDKKPKPRSLNGEHGHLLFLSREKFQVGDEPGVAYGLWPLARLTPWQNEAEDIIRDFHVMARYDATGLPRYGVLRMDADDLGRVLIGDALALPDLLHLSALSAALNDFFGARLEAVCRKAVADWKTAIVEIDQAGDPPKDTSKCDRKLPYVIYAGGDDLFIVGAWDVLPPLAQAIRWAFDRHTQGRLTMSAGISLAREKYPLYKAAEDAGGALDKAKTYPGKDALSFLDKTLPWQDGHQARAMALKLARLIDQGVEAEGSRQKAPHALLSMLGYVAYLYHKEAVPEESLATDDVVLGRWLWALHYGLRRLGKRAKPPLRGEICALAGKEILDVNNLEAARAFRPIRYLDLGVRWAEFLIRKGEDRR